MVKQEVQKVLANCDVRREHPVLVALSGGADSMALLHVFSELGYLIQAAHCNFHLRDEESNEDESFVVDYCLGQNIPLHVRHFNTIEEAEKNGVSIEMAARDLRYSWFWELLDKENFYWLATGHHGDDMIETFFLNLARGSGLRGLKGMQFKNGKLIRPMLSLRREQIELYCHENGIPYRTDSTNTDTAFQRNNIRHNVLPVMDMLNPSFFKTMMHNFRNIEEAWQIVEKEVHAVKEQIVVEEGDQMLIPIRLIKNHVQKNTILFELLRPYGFNSQTVSEIIDSFDSIPGKQFFSGNYRLVRDRFNLVIVPKDEKHKEDVFYIDSEEKEINTPLKLKLGVFRKEDDFHISRVPDCIHLDADHVEFPLILRHWRKGDQFRPLGMETFKKLSDFFVDEKLSLIEKDKTWLLLSGEDIIWVIGRRIDDRFKVTSKTRNILELRLGE